MSNRKILSVVTHLAIAVAVTICAVPPVLFFIADYRHEHASVNIEAEINSRIVGQLINTNPELWTFETLRLEELLSRRSSRSDNRAEIRSIFDVKGTLVAQSRDVLLPPLITGQATLYDAGIAVGRITVARSLRPAVNRALLVLLGSAFFGAVVFIVCRNIPLNALRLALNDLADEKEKAQITLQSIGDSVITTNGDRRIDYINPSAETMTGWTTAQAHGRDIDEVFCIVDSDTRLPAENPIRLCLKTNAVVASEHSTVLVRRTDGKEFHIEQSAAPIHGANGTLFGAVMVFRDVSERKAAQNRLQHIAYHDSLTGLPNRALFRKQLSKALVEAKFAQTHVATLFLDLDRFKTINDSLGHGIGDELLVLVAKRLEQCVGAGDVVCRMGGDEFTVVLSNIGEPLEAGLAAEKMVASIAKPFAVQGYELRLSTSIGIALSPHDGEDADVLLKHADAAMYYAKAQGRNTYRYFHATMAAQATHELQLKNALQAALDNGEFFLEYQPKQHLADNEIVGAEALLRWQSPEFGRVMPMDFVPSLEDSGNIVAVGDWVLRTAIRQAKHWHDAGQSIVVAVNVSPRQFRQSGLVERIAAMLREAELHPSFLQVEITESLLMDDAASSDAIMRELIAIGVNISLDDFGTGYSSLSYLRRFPISELKIDRSFVSDMDTDKTANMIVKTVIELGQALGMKVTAEGVETEGQRMRLRRLGCDEIQGYLVSRPLGASAFEELIRKPHRAFRAASGECHSLHQSSSFTAG